MQYQVRALDSRQQIHTVLLEALDEATRRPGATQPYPIPRPGVKAWATSGGTSFRLLLFVQELQGLLAAGLSVIESLETLIEKDPVPARRAVLDDWRSACVKASGFRPRCASSPRCFRLLLSGVVQAAENTSDLPLPAVRSQPDPGPRPLLGGLGYSGQWTATTRRVRHVQAAREHSATPVKSFKSRRRLPRGRRHLPKNGTWTPGPSRRLVYGCSSPCASSTWPIQRARQTRSNWWSPRRLQSQLQCMTHSSIAGA